MYSVTKLKNKLNLILAPLKGTAAVTVLVLVPVGSRYESKNINGVSHFVEHLLFKGTKKRPTSIDITKELDAVGAEFNAFTSKDLTGYYIKAAAKNIEMAFDILSDMMLNSVFDKTEINKERGVIVEEINMYDDNPLMALHGLFEETVFAGNSLGWQIAGPKKVVKNISRAQLVEYKNKHYQPSNFVVTVSGNFNKSRVKLLANKYFGQKNDRQVVSKYKKLINKQSQLLVNLTYKDTQQVQMGLGFPAFAQGDKRIYAAYLLSIILGGNMSSRLFDVVREQHGLAYFIRAEINAYQDTGSFMVQAGLDKSRLPAAIKLILFELKSVADEGVTDKEVKNAKDYLKGKLVLALEDSESVADWYGKQLALHKKISTPTQRLKKITAVTPAQVQKAAKEIFKEEKLNLAIIGPFKNKRDLQKLLKF